MYDDFTGIRLGSVFQGPPRHAPFLCETAVTRAGDGNLLQFALLPTSWNLYVGAPVMLHGLVMTLMAFGAISLLSGCSVGAPQPRAFGQQSAEAHKEACRQALLNRDQTDLHDAAVGVGLYGEGPYGDLGLSDPQERQEIPNCP